MSADEVQRRVRAAATRCTQTRSLFGVAAIPGFARLRLLQVHDELDCEAPCILCEPVIRARLAQLDEGSDAAVAPVQLTGRERELLPLLSGSQSVPEIARSLHVAVGTVRKQIATLRVKFGAASREQLVRRARQSGHLSG